MIKLQIVGNLGRDGSVREVNGKNVINFSVAHTERYKDNSGIQRERTTWVDCSYWTERIAVAPYLKKGTMVYVEGTPSAETYTGKDGTPAVALRLRVTNVQLLGSGTRSDGSDVSADQGNVHELAEVNGMDAHDDLPF